MVTPLRPIRSKLLCFWFPLIALLSWIPQGALAQTTFRAEAPSAVSLSEKIRVQFVLRNGDGTDFTAPEVEGASVLFPPNNAVSRANINGKISVTYTGTYLAERTGTVRIGKASIKVKGKTYYTQPLNIRILSDDKNGGKSQSQVSKATDMFIRATPSKTSAYEQEAILVTYKLYTRNANIDFENVKFPEYDGFIEQPIERSRNVQLSLEQVNGKNYYSAVLHQTLIFPQRSGSLSIPQGEFDLVAAVEQKIDNEDDYFGISSISQVRKKILSPAIPLNIRELPQPAPEGFDGAVGNFSIKVEVPDRNEIKTNEQMTVRLTISGHGNLKLITSPTIQWPDSFEAFDPKSEANLQATTDGVVGTRTIDYYAVPRNVGDFTLPAIRLVYFDPQTSKYETVATSPITLKVAKGENAGLYDQNSHTDVELLSNDIARLKNLKEGDSGSILRFIGSVWYLAFFCLIALLSILFAWGYRRYLVKQQDVVGKRLRGAAKVAQKHLAKAQTLLTEGSDADFYQAILAALLGYIADKLLLDQSQLSRQQIAAKLEAAQYSQETINSLLETLSQAEFARFAPDASSLQRQEILHKAHEAIEAIESVKCTIR